MIVNLTPTGMVPTKSMTPHVPLSPNEVVNDVNELASLGANMVHIHARDDHGEPTYEKEIYAKMIGGIREQHPDLVICVSLSGRKHQDLDQRADPLNLKGDLKPDMGSLTLSSLNFPGQASMNSPMMVRDLAARMKDVGVKPELEAFDVGMVNYANYLIKKGLIEPPYYFNIILGNIASAQIDMGQLSVIANALPDDSTWCVGGIGVTQLKANVLGMVFGHGVRIGLEDNVWLDDERTELADNRRLLGRILGMADMVGRKPYSHMEVRKAVL
jgi:uncharacterized protein (DUF849 family)